MNETPEKQQLRWGQGTREAAMDARERLIISAQNCYAQKGIKQTTIAHIAADAQITRRTVYRHFSSHEEILLAVFERVVDIFWQDLQQNLTLQGDFGDCLVEALIYSINYAKTTGRHGYMFANEGQAITNDLYIRHKRFIDASEKGAPKLLAIERFNRMFEDLETEPQLHGNLYAEVNNTLLYELGESEDHYIYKIYRENDQFIGIIEGDFYDGSQGRFLTILKTNQDVFDFFGDDALAYQLYYCAQINIGSLWIDKTD